MPSLRAEDALRRRPDPIAMTMVTGFLGAGKTAFLNRLVRDPRFSDALILVDEFGGVALDHGLVETFGDKNAVSFASGCACCALRGDFVAALESLLRRLDNGRMKPFARVLIETAGLADPAPLIHSLLTHPYLSMRFELAGVIALIDGPAGVATIDSHAEARRQIATADRIIITKLDDRSADLAPGGRENLERRLRELNPGAAIAEAAKEGFGPGAEALSARFELDSKYLGAGAWMHDFGASMRRRPAARAAEAAAEIRSIRLRSSASLAPAAFDNFLDLLTRNYGPRILRLKGLVKLSDDPGRPMLVHGLRSLLHTRLRLDQWPDQDCDTQLLVILEDLDPEAIRRLWDGFDGLASGELGPVLAPAAKTSGGLFG